MMRSPRTLRRRGTTAALTMVMTGGMLTAMTVTPTVTGAAHALTHNGLSHTLAQPPAVNLGAFGTDWAMVAPWVQTPVPATQALRTPFVGMDAQPDVAYNEMPTGIDIASWQHPNGADVDFQKVVAEGYSYVFVKATEGVNYINDYYVKDAVAAQGNGVLMGGYHYADVTADPAEQARIFAKTISVKGGTSLPPVLDIEDAKGRSPEQLNRWVRTFLQETYNEVGRKPIIYSYRSFWLNQMGNTSDFTSFPLWIADYNGQQTPTLPLPGGWKTWVLWQYASNTSITGVQAQNVDTNKFGGTMAQLRRFAAEGTIPAEQ